MENMQIYRVSDNSYSDQWSCQAVLYVSNETKASEFCNLWLNDYKAKGYRYEIEGSISDGSYYVWLYKGLALVGSLEIDIINVL